MLIRIFKQNYLSQFLIFTLLAILLWIPTFINPPYIHAQSSTSPFYNFLIPFTDQKIVWAIVAFVMLYLQSFIINSILTAHDIISKTSFLGGLVYFILMSAFAEFQHFYPALFSNFFILAVLNIFLKMYGKEYILPDCFKVGMYVSIASLFYLPTAVFIIFIWTTLLLLRTSSIRPWIIPIVSFIVPYMFLFTYYFWFDQLYIFESYINQVFFRIDNLWILKNEFSIYIGLAYTFLFMVAYLFLLAKVNEKGQQIKKKIFILSNMVLVALLGLLISNKEISEFTSFIIPVSVIIAFYFSGIERLFWVNLFFTILLISTYLNIYANAFNWI
jgi:hypothetical protein